MYIYILKSRFCTHNWLFFIDSYNDNDNNDVDIKTINTYDGDYDYNVYNYYYDKNEHEIYIFPEQSCMIEKPIPILHDDVMKWKHFPRYWLFVRGIHWSLVSMSFSRV